MNIKSFVAIGDSFTEGLEDPYGDGTYRGWADRFADHLAGVSPDLRYANLAVRGKLLQEVIDDQVPRAIELGPDLVSVAAGGNDILRPGSDPDVMAMKFGTALRTLRDAGCEVMVVTGFDPRESAVMRPLRGKVAIYNLHLRSLADRYGCHVLDLWSMTVLRDVRAWADDRLHLTPEAHRRVALRACDVLGVPADGDWKEPWPPKAPIDRLQQRRDDLRWAREHFAPWLQRRLRGRSSGDGLEPKRPDLTPVRPR